jgi:hypothetical protein
VHLLARSVQQGVVDGDGQRHASWDQMGDDQVGQRHPDRVNGPSGLREKPVRAAVMPYPLQPGACEHAADGVRAGLANEAGDQRGERGEGGSGEAAGEHAQQRGQAGG